MRAPIIAAFAAVLLAACGSDTKNETTISTDVINIPATASGKQAEPGSGPVMQLAEDKHDFGKITQGEKVSYSFQFTNTGGTDLVISGATGSCGCTVPSFPKAPVKPGQSGKIDVVFDSDGRSGLNQKTVTVVTNANPSTKVLTISANIYVPDEE